MSQLLNCLIHASHNPLQILCLITAWTLVIFCVWNSCLAAKNGVTTVKELHHIPCSNCQLFTGSYYLKCPVHPKIALSEEAINCSDYYLQGSPKNYV
jgi:hypothetical protein